MVYLNVKRQTFKIIISYLFALYKERIGTQDMNQ